MKRSRIYVLAFLIGVLTYAWFMMLFSLTLVEVIIMKYVSNSVLRTALGIIVYMIFLAVWYFSVQRFIKCKIRQL